MRFGFRQEEELVRHQTLPSGSEPIQVRWDQWGLSGARYLTGSSAGFTYDARIYGERFAILVYDNTTMARVKHISVYDFNQNRVRRHRSLFANNPAFRGKHLLDLSEPDIVPKAELSACDSVELGAFKGVVSSGGYPFLSRPAVMSQRVRLTCILAKITYYSLRFDQFQFLPR